MKKGEKNSNTIRSSHVGNKIMKLVSDFIFLSLRVKGTPPISGHAIDDDPTPYVNIYDNNKTKR